MFVCDLSAHPWVSCMIPSTSPMMVLRCWQARGIGYRGVLIRCRECMHVFLGCRLLVGPVDVAANTLRVCPMAFGFGFADLVTIIIITNVVYLF